MAAMREKLREILQALHLQGMSEALDKELERAEKAATPGVELLYRLALEEQRVRQEKSLANRLKQAKMPWDWTLESFPFAEQPGVNQDPDQDPWPAWTSYAAPKTWSLSVHPAPANPVWPAACCDRPASTAIAVASTMPRPCWMSSMPHWPTAVPPGCSSA